MNNSASMNAKPKAQGGPGVIDYAEAWYVADWDDYWSAQFPEEAAEAEAVLAGLEDAIEDLHRKRNNPAMWRNRRASAVNDLACESVGACMLRLNGRIEPAESDYTTLWAKVYELKDRPGPQKMLASAVQVYLLTDYQVAYLKKDRLQDLLEQAWLIFVGGAVHNESRSRTHGKRIPKRPDRLGTVEPLC